MHLPHLRYINYYIQGMWDRDIYHIICIDV
jgi:hypothetical protein